MWKTVSCTWNECCVFRAVDCAVSAVCQHFPPMWIASFVVCTLLARRLSWSLAQPQFKSRGGGPFPFVPRDSCAYAGDLIQRAFSIWTITVFSRNFCFTSAKQIVNEVDIWNLSLCNSLFFVRQRDFSNASWHLTGGSGFRGTVDCVLRWPVSYVRAVVVCKRHLSRVN